ncbi:uncharacterized protein PAC_00029 [Phialocephala subalpina]|uniref:Rhodopsin domain-containing protein n=1 Tax=Phialocephala subalpina TaxID=576137 RepID=A0A1L7WBK1_9HELO|nr:uncharacterized protein PAC_00029 [Phialocephala subalpina]
MAVSFNMEVKNGFGLHKTILSILFFYIRIFPSQNFKRAVFALGGITVAYSFASVCRTIWQCDPITKTWNKKLNGHCLEIGKMWYSTSVMAIVTDVAIIILLVYQIRRLQMPLFQKLALCLMFGLGIFWTFLQANVAIIVTCLPTLSRPIIRIFPSLDPHKKSSTTGYSDGFSRNNYNSKNIISSHGRSRVGAYESDEEFILHNVEPVKVRMTTNTDITFQGTKKMDMDGQGRLPLSPPPRY